MGVRDRAPGHAIVRLHDLERRANQPEI